MLVHSPSGNLFFRQSAVARASNLQSSDNPTSAEAGDTHSPNLKVPLKLFRTSAVIALITGTRILGRFWN